MKVNKKLKRIRLRGTVILLLVAAAAIVLYMNFFSDDNIAGAEETYSSATVTKGDLSQTISGSGTLEPLEQYDITSLVQGDILADYIEIGMVVSENQLLYGIDDADLDLSILRAENSLSDAVLKYENSLENVADLTLFSNYSGVVTELYVDRGDEVSSNTKVADIVNSKQLITNSKFNVPDTQNIFKGDKAMVYIEATGEVVEGVVTNVASGETVTEAGAIVRNIEISFLNPGALSQGAYVTVIVGDYACNGASIIDYSIVESIYPNGSGEIAEVYIKEGDMVQAGHLVLKLSEDDYQDDIETAYQSVEEAELSLENTREELREYEISFSNPWYHR